MDGILKAFRKTCPEFIFKKVSQESDSLELMASSESVSKNAMQICQRFLDYAAREYTADIYEAPYVVSFKKDYIAIDTYLFLKNSFPNGTNTIAISAIFATAPIPSLSTTYGSIYISAMVLPLGTNIKSI